MTDSPDNFQTDLADRLYAIVSPHSPDDQRLLLKLFETTIIHVDRTLSKAKKSLSPDSTAPRKYAAKDINNLVEQIRSGQPPELPEGKHEKHYRDPALPNLCIRLFDTGVASWVVQYKRLGRQKKKTLGNVLVLDRPAAIKAAKELLAKVTLDLLDPHEAKRERMRANKVTFETVVPLYMEHKIRQGELRPESAKAWRRYFVTGYYLRPLHHLPIDEITKQQIQTQIDDVAIRSGPKAAALCHSALRGLFKWALKTDKLPEGHRNPADNIQLPPTNKPRERVLTNDEIQLIVKTCEAWEAEILYDKQVRASTGKGILHGPPGLVDYPRVILLLFLTGCRKSEIGELKWSELDLDNGELRIPPERIKNAEELCSPLTDWAVQILRSVERRPDADNVFGYGRRSLKLPHLVRAINSRIRRAGGTPPKHWTPHDIRRTFRTHLTALHVSNDVAEALLGHVGHKSKIRRTYDRYEHWAEKRQTLAMWEANLRAIIDGTAEKFTRPSFGERKKENSA
jgi:integrase